MQRIINKYGTENSETLIVAVGGMHGNEKAGIEALESVFHYLQQENIVLSKTYLVGLRGNLKALKKDIRFIDEDLNRIWTKENIDKIHHNKLPNYPAELEELQELYYTLRSLSKRPYKRKIFIDLHTTSAEDGVFIVGVDFEKTSFLTEKVGFPVILGLDKKLANTAIAYLHDYQGFSSVAIEGGQHGNKSSIIYLAWALWQVMLNLSCVEKHKLPEKYQHFNLENKDLSKIPQSLKLKYLHQIKKGDNFIMKSGYRNFNFVREGEVIAKDKNGDIRAKSSGYLLMPLYQKEGNDGFFIVE